MTYDELTDTDRNFIAQAPLSRLQSELSKLRESGSDDQIYMRAIAEQILKLQREITRML